MYQLVRHLESFRHLRNFQAEEYLTSKIAQINTFFHLHNLDSVVVGLSGGVDSALTILLLKQASLAPDSPLKKIWGVIAPIIGPGTSGQLAATERALALARVHGLEVKMSDLTQPYQSIIRATTPASSWTLGQMASILRTPVFYYYAAVLQSEGYRSLVAGTTNRDEGSYIGFFGKASDAMVDLQIIGDLHKSEVYQLARLLRVNEEILQENPRGDVWDNMIDEEMIGSPYWFLELYLLTKEFNCDLAPLLTGEDLALYQKYTTNIEKLHQRNQHKYQVGNPAHFLDIMNRKIPNGWS